MTHIVVTIPKDRMAQVVEEEKQAQALQEAGEEVFYFWGMARKPKKLEVGDRCYFVWGNAVRAYHEVVGFSEDMTCEVTGINHPGHCVMLDPVIHEVEPLPMIGFRGYRYFGGAR